MTADGTDNDPAGAGTVHTPQYGAAPTGGPHPPPPPPTPLPPGTCRLCGHGPAADGRMGQETGLLLARRRRAVDGPLCRDCGISLFRQFTSRTVVTGWWGITSFPANVVTIVRNLAFRRRLGRLSPPRPRIAGPDLLPRPLDPGRPLIARPGTWGAAAMVALVTTGIIGAIVGGADRDETGEIVGAGRLSVTDLRVGDCFQEPSRDEVRTVQAVPCDDPHDHEMIHLFDMAPGSYPSNDAFDDAAVDECLPAFERYVGLAYGDSDLDIVSFYPNEAAWDDADHTVSCAVLALDGSRLTASVRAPAADEWGP